MKETNQYGTINARLVCSDLVVLSCYSSCNIHVVFSNKALLSLHALWEIKHVLFVHNECSYSTVGTNYVIYRTGGTFDIAHVYTLKMSRGLFLGFP